MTQQNPSVSAKIARISHFGEWAANLALLLLAAVMVFVFYQVINAPVQFVQEISKSMGQDTLIISLSGLQVAAISAIQNATNILGLVMLLTIRRLFIGIRTVGVFVPGAARRLRLIGWVVIAMAPVSIFLDILARALTSIWGESGQVSIEITVGDTGVYAVVIGLVLVIVSHIMLEAIRIYDENGTFV